MAPTSYTSFHIAILVLLTLQGAAVVVLSGYTQQRVPLTDADGNPIPRYSSFHLLTVIEALKVLISLVWCATYVNNRLEENEAVRLKAVVCMEEETGAEKIVLMNNNKSSNGQEGYKSPLEGEMNEEGDGEGLAKLAREVEAGDTMKDKEAPTRRAYAAATPATPPPSHNGEEKKRFNHLHHAGSPRAGASIPLRFFLAAFARELCLTANYAEALWMIVPALLYAVQNWLVFLSLKMNDPTVHQIFYQSRVIIVAIMMRSIFKVHFSRAKWFSLVLLAVGIAMTQLRGGFDFSTAATEEPAQKRGRPLASALSGGLSTGFVGLLAVAGAAVISSGAGVFMEYVFKRRGSQCHLSTRNAHLGFFSFIYFVLLSIAEYSSGEGRGEAALNGEVQAKNNPNHYYGNGNNRQEGEGNLSGLQVYLAHYMDGFTPLVWLLAFVYATSGVLIALVMKHLDNIMKSFSASGSIVVSGFVSYFLFDLKIHFFFMLGTMLVIASIFIYNRS